MESLISLVKEHWDTALLILIALHTFLKAIRDAIDSTPETDDNIFEKVVTLFGKVMGYLIKGKRA